MDGRDRAEIDFRWAHQVTKETRSTVLHRPFAMLSWWRCSHLKIRIVTSWGPGRYVGVY